LDELEGRLNQAVFDLYQLNAAERDLVRDMCGVGLDFLHGKQSSSAVRALTLPGIRAGIAGGKVAKVGTEIEEYIQLFLRIWSNDLDSRTKMRWQLFSSQLGAPLIALLFTFDREEPSKRTTRPVASDAWDNVLNMLDSGSFQSVGSRQIYTDSFVRVFADDAILLIKRNEKRFWTHSAAREDAEATQLQAMLRQGALR